MSHKDNYNEKNINKNKHKKIGSLTFSSNYAKVSDFISTTQSHCGRGRSHSSSISTASVSLQLDRVAAERLLVTSVECSLIAEAVAVNDLPFYFSVFCAISILGRETAASVCHVFYSNFIREPI